MQPTIYIHIGMHKTGTTSIQATLFSNRRTLLKHDINYLSLSENHSIPLFPLFSDVPHRYRLNRQDGIDTERKAAQRNAAVDAALQRELKRNTSSRFVISGEDLLSLTANGVARLKKKLEPFAADLRVLVYVREPYSYINSAFQQRCRFGATWREIIARPPLPRYRRIQKFIDAFGRDHVEFRVFDRARFVNGDLIADFLSALGVSPGLAEDLDIATANESLSFEAALVLDALNRRRRLRKERKPLLQDSPAIAKQLLSLGGRPFRCPDRVFQKVQPYVAEDLAWLRETMGEDIFSADPPKRPDVAGPPLDETLRSLAPLIEQLIASDQPAWKRVLRKGRVPLKKSAAAIRRWRAPAVTPER